MNPVSWLSKITGPEDLKGLRLEALEDLAAELRERIAQTCSRNGGHFAPSLGVVELTIALHYVYNTPVDKIVWDVGHQAYAHKMLTGRVDGFNTIRTLGGLSGFPRRDESEHDSFGVGHASTAISAALGMAAARDYRGGDHRVVAVCGDGSMGGGLCYEALNNMGYQSRDMVVVLNDNAMSISPNIGAMAHYFNQIVTTDFYKRSKETAKELIKRVPGVGEKVINITHRIEGSIKSLIVPEDTIFEKMGIRYLGPIDGHDLEELLAVFSHVRDLRGPVLVHVKTVKGKGYAYSESDPERWHSGADFEVATGEKLAPRTEAEADLAPKPPTYTEVFSQTLVELAEQDDRIVAITAGMSTGTGLDAFAKQYPERFFDVGIAESHAVCCAAGMACEGLRPVVAIYSTFLQRAYDQIIHDVALQKLPVVFAIDRGGLVGEDGPTHHGVFDISFLRMIPDLVVMAPRDEAVLRSMMATAARYEDGPIAYRYPRGRTTGLATGAEVEPLEIGTGEVLREPTNGAAPRVAILSIGTMAAAALEAAELLDTGMDDGVATTVVDMRFVKPLDRRLLLEMAQDCDLIVTVEENVIAGGFGSAVREALSAMGEPVRTVSIGIPDTWVEHGAIADLHRRYGLDAEQIASTVRAAATEPRSVAP